jgi:hypothetical protein
MANRFLSGLALASGLSFSAASGAVTLIEEGFDNIASLADVWSLVNQSTAGGLTATFFQGSTAVFDAQAGAANSYIASNYEVAAPGGTVSNWLVTPSFSTEVAGSVSFWLRGDPFEGTQDVVKYGFIDVAPSGTAAGTFASSTTVTANTAGWQQITVSFAAGGAGSVGRFGWEHGNVAANYIGIDSVLITNVSAVPEPAESLLLSLGLLGVFLMRRRQQ